MELKKSFDFKIQEGKNNKKIALHFIFLLGLVSLLGDIVYEGARSISGPYLAVLGASASMVGLISGLGEFIGYGLRLLSGYLADRTKSYWFFTIIGYGLLLAIPFLAFAGHWQVAAFLIILERMGKAIRSPARDAILSHATKQVGRGWGFGIHEALDQVGAIIGPLIFSTVFILKGGYREGFSLLWIPAFLALSILLMAKSKVPSPEKLEITEGLVQEKTEVKKKLPRVYWLYTLFTFLSVAGFAHFQIISYHFKVQSVLTEVQIPLFYALAMGVDALIALVMGKIYDKIGLISLITIPFLTIMIPPLVFSPSYTFILAGVILWGVVMGIHETIMRAAIAELTAFQHRGSAYGIFNTAYGISWFLGSTIMGFLYEASTVYIILFVIGIELLSLPIFFRINQEVKSSPLK